MYSCEPLHMAEQRHDDQLEPTHSIIKCQKSILTVGAYSKYYSQNIYIFFLEHHGFFCKKTLFALLPPGKLLGCLPTDGLALMWHIPATLSSAQSRQAVIKNGCNVHDCVKLRRGFSQLSFMYVLFSFNIFLITHFRAVLSFETPLEHNRNP